ncbi:MAG TPA: hypothetical protein PLI53_04760 [Geobacteraceae bacterium]|nr:hypothetical protein [Geobacteraceae bacterium]
MLFNSFSTGGVEKVMRYGLRFHRFRKRIEQFSGYGWRGRFACALLLFFRGPCSGSFFFRFNLCGGGWYEGCRFGRLQNMKMRSGDSPAFSITEFDGCHGGCNFDYFSGAPFEGHSVTDKVSGF